jgi:hypothetical protein
MAARPTTNWPLLSAAFKRLNTDAITAAQDIIGRGDVPVTGTRNDWIDNNTTPERVEALLAKARFTLVHSLW